MDLFVVSFRLVHFICGVFWAGVAFFNVLMLEPAVKAAGAEGQKTMGMLQRVGMSTALGITGGLTMLSGLALYWRDSGGFLFTWIGSPQGVVFTVGALAGIAGGVIGGAMVGRAAKSLGELGAAVAQSGGKPSDEQAGQLAALQNRLHLGGQINAVLLLIAVICMAVAPELLSR